MRLGVDNGLTQTTIPREEKKENRTIHLLCMGVRTSKASEIQGKLAVLELHKLADRAIQFAL